MSGNNHITICLGSSCHARGNSRNLEIIRDYIETNQLKSTVEVKGVLCTCICQKGPVIVINDIRCEKVLPDAVIPLLEKHMIK